MRILSLIGACLLLGACVFGTSKKSTFYTLSPVPVEPVSKNYTSFVGVNRVQLPKYVDRPQIVTQGQDSVEVIISEYNRWVESPTVLATRVLTEDLSALLPHTQIKMNQFRTEKFNQIISVEVVSMNAALGDKAELNAWYTVKENSGKILFRQKFVQSVEIGKGYDDLAKGYSQLWMMLSQSVAKHLIK